MMIYPLILATLSMASVLMFTASFRSRVSSGCYTLHLFTCSCAILMFLGYYLLAKGVRGFLLVVAKRRRAGFFSRAPPRSYCMEKYGSELEGEELELDLEELQPRSSHSEETFDGSKVWSNVYGLGFGIFCMVYCMQVPSRLCTSTLCTTLWLISTEEYLQRRADYGTFLGFQDRVIMPFMLVTYFVGVCLLWFSIPSIESADFAVVNTLIPLAGPSAMRYLKRPKDILKTLELGAPVAGLISGCIICTILSGQTDCVYQHFLQMTPAALLNETEDGGIVNRAVVLPMLGDASKNKTIPIHPLVVLSILGAPVFAACALMGVVSSCTSGRTMDAAASFMMISSSIERAGLCAQKGDPPAGNGLDPVTLVPVARGRDLLGVTVVLATVVTLSLAVYRSYFGDEVKDVDKGKTPAQARTGSTSPLPPYSGSISPLSPAISETWD